MRKKMRGNEKFFFPKSEGKRRVCRGGGRERRIKSISSWLNCRLNEVHSRFVFPPFMSLLLCFLSKLSSFSLVSINWIS